MQVPRIIKTSLLALMVVGYCGCYYDVEEELYGTSECNTSDMSYSSDIVPIIDSKCIACHSTAANFGNVTLEGHQKLLIYVNDGSLIGAIKHAAGFSAMPKNGAKLLDCEIEKIEAWIQAGALDN